MKNLFLFLCAISALSLVACSDDDATPVTGVNIATVNGALSNTQTKLEALIPDTSGVSASPLQRVAMTTEWTTGSNTYAHGGDFGDSPRGYVRNHGDNTVQSSLMFRLNQTIENVCLFSTALPSTNGIPDLNPGSTVTLTAALKSSLSSTCGVALSDLPADGTVVGYRVVDTSSVSGSQYDREVGFDMSGGSTYTDIFRFTFTSTLNRFSFTEDSTNDSIALFEYDPVNGLLRFEFSEDAPAPFKLHYRGILNETSNLGRFVAVVIANSDVSTAVVSTEEGAGDEIHVSYSFDDDANTNDFTDGNACINANTFAIATDNTLTCGNITGAAASGFTLDVDTAVTSGNITSSDETTTIQFTDLATILTAAQAQ